VVAQPEIGAAAVEQPGDEEVEPRPQQEEGARRDEGEEEGGDCAHSAAPDHPGLYCHPGKSRDPSCRIALAAAWIPAFAGMTVVGAVPSTAGTGAAPTCPPREGGDPSRRIASAERWIPALAGMTVRGWPACL